MSPAAEVAARRHRAPSAQVQPSIAQQALWGLARLTFYGYIGLNLLTIGLGGFLTAPIMSWYFYGDWRFWRHWRSAKGLYPHGYRMLWYLVQGRNGGFMLGVPLFAPPHSGADATLVELRKTWEFGTSCGPCTRCCTKIKCPILDTERGLCSGYNSFFWRYFNCGRFPTEQRELDFYLCNKWELRQRPGESPRHRPGLAPEPEEMVA